MKSKLGIMDRRVPVIWVSASAALLCLLLPFLQLSLVSGNSEGLFFLNPFVFSFMI